MIETAVPPGRTRPQTPPETRPQARPEPSPAGARRRICVLSEDLSDPPDEGVKLSALRIAAELGRQHDVSLISTHGSPARFGTLGGRVVRAPRTFVGAALRDAITEARPEVCVYVARASTTLMSFVRCRVLKAYWPEARVVLVGLQARRHPRPVQALIRRLAPELVCVQSLESQRYLERLGCRTALLPSGVDVARFAPVSPEDKAELRARYGLRSDAPVVLHVGHLQAGRGVGVLAEMTRFAQVVLVASSSTAQEAALAGSLRDAGVRVLTAYQPHVEELYQLADCYVFPVQSVDNSIELPLSVLEALACDLPVVTTRFGGLPRLFAGAPGITFVDGPEALVTAAAQVSRQSRQHAAAPASTGPSTSPSTEQSARPSARPSTRPLALPYSWQAIADRLLEEVYSKEEERRG